MSESITNYLLSLMGQLDYVSVFVLMAAESSLLPVPSELVMAPAGYLAASGHLNFWLVLLAGSLGALAGSIASYYLAWWLGRPLLIRFGHYCFIQEHHFDQAERFIHQHGEIAIFSGRFVPGIRHLISLPAGLAKMSLRRFGFYTFLGAGLWNATLEVLGYLIGDNPIWIKEHSAWIISGALFFVTVVVLIYLHRQRTATTHQ